jgi:PAS domain S-box-containing protein
MNSYWNQLFQQINVVLITLDKEGNFTSLNPAAERIYCMPAAELIGKPISTVLDPFSHEKAAVMIQRTFQFGEVVEWELDHIQEDNSLVLLGYTTSILFDSLGNQVGIAAIGIDLTSKLELTSKLALANQDLEGTLNKLEKTLAELKSTQAQLVQAEKMRTLGQLVAGIAHEINNPAAFVANNLAHLKHILPSLENLFNSYNNLKELASETQKVLIQNSENEAGVEYLWDDLKAIVRESQDGIERIRQIVLSLRTFSHLDEAELKYVDISAGIISTVQLIRPMCKNRIQIIEDYQDLPVISCYPGELNQVFLNLLTNSVQAIHGEGRIEISTAVRDDHILVSIYDTGSGMDSMTLSKIGEPFFTTKPVGSGTGLGLSISFGIIERHQGRLWFESQVDSGTTAYVELPIK